jgi:hypothetical protein
VPKRDADRPDHSPPSAARSLSFRHAARSAPGLRQVDGGGLVLLAPRMLGCGEEHRRATSSSSGNFTIDSNPSPPQSAAALCPNKSKRYPFCSAVKIGLKGPHRTQLRARCGPPYPRPDIGCVGSAACCCCRLRTVGARLLGRRERLSHLSFVSPSSFRSCFRMMGGWSSSKSGSPGSQTETTD